LPFPRAYLLFDYPVYVDPLKLIIALLSLAEPAISFLYVIQIRDLPSSQIQSRLSRLPSPVWSEPFFLLLLKISRKFLFSLTDEAIVRTETSPRGPFAVSPPFSFLNDIASSLLLTRRVLLSGYRVCFYPSVPKIPPSGTRAFGSLVLVIPLSPLSLSASSGSLFPPGSPPFDFLAIERLFRL